MNQASKIHFCNVVLRSTSLSQIAEKSLMDSDSYKASGLKQMRTQACNSWLCNVDRSTLQDPVSDALIYECIMLGDHCLEKT